MFNSFSRRVSLIALLLMLGAVPALLADAEMPWAETLEDAMAKAEKTGKPLMMDFYTDW